VKLGRALSQQQRHAEALDEFRKAVAIDPYNGLNHLLVAMECVQLGRTAEAIEECNAALRVQADLVEAQRMIDDLTRTAGHVPSL
jgi:Flp pilus assembly protein TadD